MLHADPLRIREAIEAIVFLWGKEGKRRERKQFFPVFFYLCGKLVLSLASFFSRSLCITLFLKAIMQPNLLAQSISRLEREAETSENAAEAALRIGELLLSKEVREREFFRLIEKR